MSIIAELHNNNESAFVLCELKYLPKTFPWNISSRTLEYVRSMCHLLASATLSECVVIKRTANLFKYDKKLQSSTSLTSNQNFQAVFFSRLCISVLWANSAKLSLVRRELKQNSRRVIAAQFQKKPKQLLNLFLPLNYRRLP